ncbi:MAG: hypothetical protein R3C58_03635 [Parvularculaceae bacterium]
MKVGRFPFVGNGKTRLRWATRRLGQTVFDEKTGELWAYRESAARK